MEFSLQRNDAVNFLQEHPVGVLTTLNAAMIPESSAIYFAADARFSCLFTTKTQTRKFSNIQNGSPAVILSFSEGKLASAEVQGTIEVIVDAMEIAHAIEQFNTIVASRKMGYWVPPIAQIEAGEYVVCRLVPKTVRFNQFAHAFGDGDDARQAVFEL
jgi:hypothetical protein